MKVTVLGSGTSTGVPTVGCKCAVCTSDNPRNNRLRSSIYIQTEATGVLVDSGPDLRLQALRAGISSIEHVLYTHSHADHVFGIDDLRPFNFISGNPISAYANSHTADELERNFRYCFHRDPEYVGGQPPQLKLNRITSEKPFRAGDLDVLPLSVFHGSLEVLAFRIGNFAYVTDCSLIPEKTKAHLGGLDTLILNGLRNRPHNTHLTIDQAVDQIRELKPKRAYLTHLSHEIEHESENLRLSKISDVSVALAYDGLVIED
jgi:phosphoribosyl 1,2-cyclic phosphate phosphodiesterase